MENSVIVTSNASGAVINPTKNPDYGYIRVIQHRVVINDQGWAEGKPLSALINGKMEDLKKLNYRDGDIMQGKIRIVERIEPFNTKNPERDIKIAGETAIICSVQGQPIYRNCFYTPNKDKEDILIEHDNGEEIRSVLKQLKTASPNLSE